MVSQGMTLMILLTTTTVINNLNRISARPDPTSFCQCDRIGREG